MEIRAARLAACILAASIAALPAGAADGDAASPELSFGTDSEPTTVGTMSTQRARDRLFVFSILLGAQNRPEYFGSEETEVAPSFRPTVFALRFGNIRAGDPTDAMEDDPIARPTGFFLGPSFRFVSGRNADDHEELDGLDDIDPTLEVGALVGYVWPAVETFGQVRYGLGGSEAWVGELGANFVARPVDGVSFRLGPRLLFGSDAYNETYFGVTAEESADSGLARYDPAGGLVSTGVEMIATYRIGERWWLEGRARWDRLEEDAAESPIVEQGTRDQGTVSIGVRRAFFLEF